MPQQNTKAPSLDNDVSSQSQSDAATEVMYTTVYTFVVYDHDKQATATYPRMATRRTIANMRGKVNEDSAWVVEDSQLDAEGFYVGN